MTEVVGYIALGVVIAIVVAIGCFLRICLRQQNPKGCGRTRGSSRERREDGNLGTCEFSCFVFLLDMDVAFI